jgi:hypothetical protein
MVDALQKLGVNVTFKPTDQMFWGIVAVCVVGLIWAQWQSKRESKELQEMEDEVAKAEMGGAGK